MKTMDNPQMYNWSDIQSQYPDKWVIITDVEEKDGNIIKCRLQCICDSSERAVVIKKYKQQGVRFECERTTFCAPNIGVIC